MCYVLSLPRRAGPCVGMMSCPYLEVKVRVLECYVLSLPLSAGPCVGMLRLVLTSKCRSVCWNVMSCPYL